MKIGSFTLDVYLDKTSRPKCLICNIMNVFLERYEIPEFVCSSLINEFFACLLLATIYPRIILVFPFRPLLMSVTIHFFRIKTYPPLPFHFSISYFKWKVTIPLFCDRFHCRFRSDFHQNSAVNSGLVNLWMLLSLNHDLLLFGRRMKQGDYSKRGRRVLVTEWEHNLDLLDTLRSQIFIIATWFNEGFSWPDVLMVHYLGF